MQESEQRTITLDHTPFTIGRKTDRDLIIADPRVSRDHASILSEGGDYVLVDMGSKHGTFVNGEKAERHKLNTNDRVEFGARGGPCIVFNPTAAGTSSAREFLSQISGIEVRGGASDLEKLTFFLEAARKLNTTGVVDEILVTLVDSTLRLTGAERGCVFLRAASRKNVSFSRSSAPTALGYPAEELARRARAGGGGIEHDAGAAAGAEFHPVIGVQLVALRLLAVPQRCRACCHVDQRVVRTCSEDGSVVARHPRIRDHQVAVGLAPDGERRMVQRDGALLGFLHEDQLRKPGGPAHRQRRGRGRRYEVGV